MGMLLTVNRRFTFCASRRLARDGWSAEENDRVYGAGREGRWGSGENFQAHLVFGGAIDPRTGFLVNLTEVRDALHGVIDGRYDHRFLNLDTPPFGDRPPTPENLASQLLVEAKDACRGLAAQPVACHLVESPSSGATAYASGAVEREHVLTFSAARRTWSPHLTDEENAGLFGRASAASGHGHGYRLRVVLAGPVDGATGTIAPHGDAARALASLHGELDHRNLSVDVPALAGGPMTTEWLSRFVFRRLSNGLPVARVRLNETADLFAEHDGRRTSLGLVRGFSAAHCLRSPRLSDAENARVYGHCANPNGHGHRYGVEATVAGALDERTGIVARLPEVDRWLSAAIEGWDRRHLDRECDEFRERPSTGENIVACLWDRLGSEAGRELVRVRLFETENNRFTGRAGGA